MLMLKDTSAVSPAPGLSLDDQVTHSRDTFPKFFLKGPEMFSSCLTWLPQRAAYRLPFHEWEAHRLCSSQGLTDFWGPQAPYNNSSQAPL